MKSYQHENYQDKNMIKQPLDIKIKQEDAFYNIRDFKKEPTLDPFCKIINEYENLNQKRSYIKKNQEKIRRWTKEEQILYENFIFMYQDVMKNSSSKRNSKIFLLMSKFIRTKTPSQCRSHHQKFFPKILHDKVEQDLDIPTNKFNIQNSLQGIKKKNKYKRQKQVKNEKVPQQENGQEMGGMIQDMNMDFMNQLYYNQTPTEEELLNQVMNLQKMIFYQQPQFDNNFLMNQENFQNQFINLQNPMNNPALQESNQQKQHIYDNCLQDNHINQDEKALFTQPQNFLNKPLFVLNYMESKMKNYLQQLKQKVIN